MKSLLHAAQGLSQSKIPVWFMRQAGRYLPEYREIRKQHDTLTMFKTPSIATEVTLQPLRRFNLDGAILYADILLIPDALGVNLKFVTGEGPKIAHTIRRAKDLTQLRNLENTEKLIEQLSYVGETITRVVPQLPNHVTMLGFAGSPFTVASYMIEGESGSKNNFAETKKLIATEPDTFHALMNALTNITIAYLDMQIKCGAEVIQLFESWSGVLNAEQYNEFCLPYVHKIIHAIQKQVPVILFLGTTAHLLNSVIQADTVPNVLSVDYRVNLVDVSKQIGAKKIGLQGNLDPHLLFKSQNEIKCGVQACVKAGCAHSSGYIFNLGHGIDQHTPLENVGYVVDLLAEMPHQTVLPVNL